MLLAMSVPALAGNPHFVGQPQVDNVDGVLTVSGKVAGLGNEEQIFVEVTALAECVNPGGKKPSAENKDEVSISGTFPVQNGKADFLLELDGAAQITPSCEPPMTIEYSDVFIGVDTNGDGIADLTRFFAGPF
ncbi:MAG TPA: hypothetical protein VFZ70_10335 [Euzebyales bacterium]